MNIDSHVFYQFTLAGEVFLRSFLFDSIDFIILVDGIINCVFSPGCYASDINSVEFCGFPVYLRTGTGFSSIFLKSFSSLSKNFCVPKPRDSSTWSNIIISMELLFLLTRTHGLAPMHDIFSASK